MAKACAY